MDRKPRWKPFSLLHSFVSWGKSAGWRSALTLASLRVRTGLGFPEPRVIRIKPRRARYAVIARLGNSSDMGVFHQIFRDDEYACLRDISAPRFIVDLGANTGYASAYFLSCFAEATVLAVEPDAATFKILRRNLAPYGNRGTALLGAAWSHNARLRLTAGAGGDTREWANQVVEAEGDEGRVEGFDMPTLLRMSQAEVIDLLKVDIEGSEVEVFNHTAAGWLSRVRNICIELHGDECRAVFLKALDDYSYELGTSGELTICRNLRARA